MFLLDKAPLVIYIKKNSLDFYFNQKEEHLEFPAGVIKDGDIIGPSQYEKLVEDFLVNNKLKKQTTLFILSEEIVFQKIIPFTDIKMLDEEFTNFTEMVPIEDGKLRKKYVQVDGNIYLFAVNKWLFEKLIEVLRKSGWEIMAAIPLTLFSQDSTLNAEIIKKIISKKQLIKKADFLTDNESLSKGPVINMKRLTILFISLLIIIFTAGALFFRQYFINKTSKNLNKTQPSTNPLVSTESANLKIATETATLTPDQLNVTVLNGSGIAGQAAEIKELLTQLGFKNINTDNAQETSDKTIVVFSSKVASDLREKIISLLQDNFDSVTTQNDSSLSDTDILITTGKPKTTP